MLSGGSWVQIPAGSTTRVFKQTGETDDRVIGGGGGGGGVKELILVLEMSTGSFPGGVVYLSRIIHVMGYGWVTVSS